MTHDVPAPLIPHPLMPRYYKSAEERRAYIATIFRETAGDYDRVESLLSFGTGKWYRRQALRRSGLRRRMTIADVAAGTGLVSREARRIVGKLGRVIAMDPNEAMLSRIGTGEGIETLVAVAESLPLPDASVDFVSMGYALRHVEDLHAMFTEFARVLKPGGRVCVLEIMRPAGRVSRAVLKAYLALVSGAAGKFARLSPRTPELWRYYWDTIERCVAAEEVMRAMKGAGFEDVACYKSLGLFSEFTGTRR